MKENLVLLQLACSH